MGYFNIFYKITRIIDMLTRKRNRKIIVAILIIIGVIFLLHNKGYCAQEDTTYTTDTTYFILERYQSLVNTFVIAFDKYYGKDTNQTNQFNALFDSVQNGNFLYFHQIGINNNIRILTYDRTTSKTLVDTNLVYNDGTRVPSTAYNLTWYEGNTYKVINVANGDYGYSLYGTTASADFNYAIPYILIYRMPIEVIQCMERAGYTYTNNQDIIDIKTQMNQIKNKIDTTNDKLEGISEDINSTDYNQNVVSVDTTAVDSMSDTEVNGLFSTIVTNFNNALTMWNGTTSIIFGIPFTNGRYITIPDNIVSSKLPTQFLDLVHAFWYFVFGLYLFRFINNLIKKIRSGDILNGYSNENEVITSNML